MPPEPQVIPASDELLQMREALLWAQLAQLGVEATRVEVTSAVSEARETWPDAVVWVRPGRWWWPRWLWRWTLECTLSEPCFRVQVLLALLSDPS